MDAEREFEILCKKGGEIIESAISDSEEAHEAGKVGRAYQRRPQRRVGAPSSSREEQDATE